MNLALLSDTISGPPGAGNTATALTTTLAAKEQRIMADPTVFERVRDRKTGQFTPGPRPETSGQDNPAWNGGRVWSGKYFRIFVGRGHHLANARGYAYEHRVVAEKKIGRPLRASEVVHHINGHTTDNRPENLSVEASHTEHMLHQHADRARLLRMQKLGAQAKHRKTMTVTLPKVVEGVRMLIAQRIKPTQRNCRSIRGYNSIQKYISQPRLVAMAKGEEPCAA